MGNNQGQPVDLSKLSQRELLILVVTKVDVLEKASGIQTDRQNTMAIELAIVKTKIKQQAGIIGFFTGLGSSIIMWLITKH
jgi:predicted HAD superfamily hydrolase